jgi:hypothetical protein
MDYPDNGRQKPQDSGRLRQKVPRLTVRAIRPIFKERSLKAYLMKVEGPGSTQQTSRTGKKDKVGGGGGSFGDMLTGGTASSAPASAPQTISSIDTLLAVQGAEDPTEKAAKKRMKARAGRVLDELEKIRVGLLTGTLTLGDVINIADVVASHREKIMDPGLTAILDEIDLRAQVEIAKMKMAMGGNSDK